MKAFVLVFLAIASCAQVQAQRTGISIGVGNFGCGEYLEDRKKGSTTQDGITATWVWGYLSAYNQFSTLPQVKPPDMPTVLAYLDKHCRDYPLTTINLGAIALIGELGGWQSPTFKRP